MQNCKFGNEKYKRNCARLAIYRDFKQLDSYTIELSSYGYEIKGSGGGYEDNDVEEFKPVDFLNFGNHLF